MILPDVNLLVYAYNGASQQHLAARQWLETAMSDDEPVGLPWAVLHAFLRLTTSSRVWRTLSAREALAITVTQLSTSVPCLCELTLSR